MIARKRATETDESSNDQHNALDAAGAGTNGPKRRRVGYSLQPLLSWLGRSLASLNIGQPNVPDHLFVQLVGSPQAVEVATTGCPTVSRFISAIKKELPEDLGSISRNRITLHLNAESEPLEVDLKLSQLCTDRATAGRCVETALIVKIQSTGIIDDYKQISDHSFKAF